MSKSANQKTVLAEKAKLKKMSMALEDLSWAFRSMKLETIQEAADIIGMLALEQDIASVKNNAFTKSLQSSNENKRFLIGVLPTLFQDKRLFPANDDIVEFAKIALNLTVKHAEKRSRYEIIGTIICETDVIDETKLIDLASALERIVDNNEHVTRLIEKKKVGSFSWNETIQELLKNK